ncbi:MAG: DUF5009 domain-containing protein [candidate division KSB1 bacterium]|nr:DUF5009 domain-containing protein [candidate division KSB1 bacterium]
MGEPQKRLTSLDALRGFDMFWIVGGASVFIALANLTDWGVLNWFAHQLHHAEWDGFRFFDNIFPLFLFIAGVSMPFSFAKRVENGQTWKQIYKHIFIRAGLLVLFGFIYNGLLQFNFESMRYASVLGRIGLGWLFAALIYYHTSLRGQIIWFVAILLLYWAALMLIPVPGFGAGDLSMQGSLVGYVDRMLLPGVLYKTVHDPEGILSTIPAVATALMGVFTGRFLRYVSEFWTPARKAAAILTAGALSMGLGALWGLVFPVNKNLWTSSFVLVAGGLSLILLAVFYYVIDVRGMKKWAFPFVVIGLNPITIYMCHGGFIDFGATSEYVFGGVMSLAGAAEPLIAAVTYVLVGWLFLYALYQLKLFLKV